MAEARAQAATAPRLRHHCLGLAMAAIQRGDFEAANQVLQAHPDAGLTLYDVFSHSQIELETQNQELRQAQRRTESLLTWTGQLFRQIPVPALLLDNVGLIQDANDRAMSDLELGTMQPARGMPLRRLMASADCEFRLQHALHGAQEGRVTILADVQMLSAQGRPLWVTLTVVPMREQPEELDSRLMCIVDNQTDRLEVQRAQEAATQAAQQRDFARATSEANHRLMARVSHEFRTPLNAVIGFSDLLMASPAPMVEPSAREYVSHIRDAGMNLLKLVEEVLQVNQLNGHEGAAQAAQKVDLHQVAGEVVTLLSDLARRTDVSLTLELPELPLPAARGHVRRIREVIINLVSNALKYNLPNGWVTLTLGTVGQRVWLGVSDGGKGMTRQQLDHLFEPFNRLGADATNLHGHGLGLVITKGLLESMDGRLSVTSTPGVGSCFVAEWPIWHEDGHLAHAASSQPAPN